MTSLQDNNQNQTIPQIHRSGRTWSLKKQNAAQQQNSLASQHQNVIVVKQQVSVYELAWEDLKKVLLELFPQHPIEFTEDVSFPDLPEH
jgi:hypothetical protein